ncbi:MAG: hypothetical protein ACFFE6_00340 [Candidatus Thorarchaeota archaeon]
MAPEKSDEALEAIQKKVDKLSEELTGLREELKAINSVEEMNKKIDALDSELKEVDDNFEIVGKKIDELVKSVKGLDTTKKLDEITKSVSGFGSDLKEIKDSKEAEVIIKKIDDILVSIADVEVLAKKLDDLEGYIASLSGLEEKVQDLGSQLGETNEIVGIIVRQLDDIERKYNISIDKVTEAVDLLTKFMEEGQSFVAESETPSKKPKETKDQEAPKVREPTKASLPSTIDSLMSGLLDLVVPQTEATDMAEALEDVRDQLTTQIEGHTPVLFQFGKRARELKSYPPTATLNENDIASLSRDIKSWTSKLKETTKG